jgi:hypothetical protein
MRIISTSEWPNGPNGTPERKRYAVTLDAATAPLIAKGIK